MCNMSNLNVFGAQLWEFLAILQNLEVIKNRVHALNCFPVFGHSLVTVFQWNNIKRCYVQPGCIHYKCHKEENCVKKLYFPLFFTVHVK